MAITELTGAFSGASSTPASDFRIMLATQFAALGGNWAVVDNGYTNGTSIRSVITNTAGFAIMLVTSTVTTDLTMNIYFGQSYNTGTHTLSNVGFASGSGLSNATGFTGINYNPTSVQVNTSTPSIHQSYNQYNATSGQTSWNIIYDTNYAIIGVKDGTTSLGKWLYFGAAESLVGNSTLTDSNNFVLAQNWSNSTSSFFRGAIILQSLGNNSVSITHGGSLVPEANINLVAGVGTNTQRDKYATEPTKGSACNIIVTRETTDIHTATDPSTYGFKRFRLNSMIFTDSSGSAYGDTTQIGSAVYRYIGGINSVVTLTTSTLSGWVRIN